MPGPKVVQLDIHARDSLAQQQFYSELFGWTFDPAGDSSQYAWAFDSTSKRSFGGIGQAAPDDAPGVSFFVQVEDLPALFSEAARLGGGTFWGPTEFPDGMVVGCIRDPEGIGILAIMPGREGLPYSIRPPVPDDRWMWEIRSRQPDRLRSFYRELFGWTIDEPNDWGWSAVDTGNEGGPSGSISGAEAPCVFTYITVDDVESATNRAIQLGATLELAHWQVSTTTSIAIVSDPEGNQLGFRSWDNIQG